MTFKARNDQKINVLPLEVFLKSVIYLEPRIYISYKRMEGLICPLE